jgi:hypothetical protein
VLYPSIYILASLCFDTAAQDAVVVLHFLEIALYPQYIFPLCCTYRSAARPPALLITRIYVEIPVQVLLERLAE